MPHNDPASPASIMDACRANLELTQPKFELPARLFHLTDTEGLLGIVTNKTLWSSLATSLNDCLEVRYALDLAAKILESRLRLEPAEYHSALLEYLLDPSSAPPEVHAEVSSFVVAFCAKCEKSGQWLHYGRSGRGIAIGFSSSIAKPLRRDLVKIDYSGESQRTRLVSLMDVGREIVQALPSNMDGKTRISRARRTAHVVSLFLPMLAAGMKHPAFLEEDEWRLVGHHIVLNGKVLQVLHDATGKTEIKYRRLNDRLVPYEELSFSNIPNAIPEIILGYTAASTPDAMRVLLLDKGFDASVRRSEVPVR